MATKAKIGVLGASGYTGSELVRMLLRHPRSEIVLLTADRSAGKTMREVLPQFSPFELPTLVAQVFQFLQRVMQFSRQIGSQLCEDSPSGDAIIKAAYKVFGTSRRWCGLNNCKLR